MTQNNTNNTQAKQGQQPVLPPPPPPPNTPATDKISATGGDNTPEDNQASNSDENTNAAEPLLRFVHETKTAPWNTNKVNAKK